MQTMQPTHDRQTFCHRKQWIEHRVNSESGLSTLTDVINLIDRRNNDISSISCDQTICDDAKPDTRPKRNRRLPARYRDSADIQGTISSDPQCGDMPAAKNLAQKQNKTERSTRQRRQRRQGLLNRTAPTATKLGVTEWITVFLADKQKEDPDIEPAFN